MLFILQEMKVIGSLYCIEMATIWLQQKEIREALLLLVITITEYKMENFNVEITRIKILANLIKIGVFGADTIFSNILFEKLGITLEIF